MENKKHNKLKLVGAIALPLMLGLSACQSTQYNNDNVILEKQEIKQRKNITYDESNFSITIYNNDNEFNDFNNQLMQYLFDNNHKSQSARLIVEGTLYYSYQSVNGGDVNSASGILKGVYSDTFGEKLGFFYGDGYSKAFPTPTWSYTDGTNIINTLTGYTIISEELYNLFAPQESATMGDTIIGSIASGLGLIPNIANEFLVGFSTIFYNSETQQLTTFAIFTLILLGISISFAVIKLVLNIVRSNTGA